MSRARSLPPGWSGGAPRYVHNESGAVVERRLNPATGLIEWCVDAPGQDPQFTGQDLHDALAIASGA